MHVPQNFILYADFVKKKNKPKEWESGSYFSTKTYVVGTH